MREEGKKRWTEQERAKYERRKKRNGESWKESDKKERGIKQKVTGSKEKRTDQQMREETRM